MEVVQNLLKSHVDSIAFFCQGYSTFLRTYTNAPPTYVIGKKDLVPLPFKVVMPS